MVPSCMACRIGFASILVVTASIVSTATAQVAAVPRAVAVRPEDQIVAASAMVLSEAMATPGNAIPQAMLNDCHGVAIIPNVVKGSFIVGARHGRGLLFVREPDGGELQGVWHAPVFITLTGGNIGWQIGVQSSDLVLVFKTARSIQGLLSGKLTLGADAAAAAGPVGREAAVATDGKLQAEIYTYSRSRGLFAGVSVDGSVVQIDQFATGNYYPSAGPGQPVVVPEPAGNLTVAVAQFAGHANLGIDPMASQRPASSGLVQQNAAKESEVLRGQIVQIAPRLYQVLDDRWTTYLALPMAMIRGENPTPEELATTIERFATVAANPQYQTLATRPEFRSVQGLLAHYQQSLSATAGQLQLPPPPR